MEQVINKDILNYLQANNLISPDQHGFLKMRSTCTNLIECTNDWSTAMQLHQGTDIIYFDFKKAFDSVSHQKLLIKPQAYGISGNLFLWIRKFLWNRTQAVKMNGQLSNNGNVTSGVPQGSVLGPMLFLIYINDVVDIFTDNSVKYKLFADDIEFYSISSPHNSSLQTAIDRLVLWSETWQLQLAPERCLQASIKTTGNSTTPNQYTIRSRPISFTDNIRDLGVLIVSLLTYFQSPYQQYHSQGFYQTTPYPQMLSITRQANIDQSILNLCSANP